MVFNLEGQSQTLRRLPGGKPGGPGCLLPLDLVSMTRNTACMLEPSLRCTERGRAVCGCGLPGMLPAPLFWRPRGPRSRRRGPCVPGSCQLPP